VTEASPEDVVEQALPVDAADDPAGLPVEVPLESDPADALEQAAEVPLDEDDLR
jgi:hypothetical protein